MIPYVLIFVIVVLFIALFKTAKEKVKAREFTHEPKDFLLKHQESWFSPIYRNILYSGNGGESWKYLMNCVNPLFTAGDNVMKYNYSYEKETFNLEKTAFSYYRNRFKTYQDILDYHKEQYDRYLSGLEKIKKARKQYQEHLKINSL